MPETATELTVLTVELTLTEKAEVAGTMLARARSYIIARAEGDAFSTTELTYTGKGAATLLVTFCAVNDAACPPEEVCRGLVDGLE